MSKQLNDFMCGLERRNPGETEFHQAVYEVVEDILPFVTKNKFIADNPREAL